ncbi:MAG: hypothetical protein IH991_18535 [Planctomycetes bacterium]|nr:hypothetical protein [Planctomycetota bacterium]
MHCAVLTLLVCALPNAVPDTIVVCSDTFRESLKPWVQHRTKQGHRLAFVSNKNSADEIRAEIRKAAKAGQLQYIVLIGDAKPKGDANRKGNNKDRELTVPTHFAKAKVNIQWGSEPEIATDNWYADLDDDQIPDVAVGRLTADSKDELDTIVRKILDYENQRDFGIWRRRINFVAGVGGFGKLADSILEMATKEILTSKVPAAYATTMTYGSWRSPYCPDPRQFQHAAMHRLNEGCLFWVYIGHGQRRHLDRVRTPQGWHHIMSTRDVEKMQSTHGAPLALFLACYTGAFDEPLDCLAEEMLRRPGGPVAIVCGSRVTMPYAMAVMSHEFLHELFAKRHATIGDLVLNTKQRLVAPVKPNADGARLRQLIDAIALTISPTAKQMDAERKEHLLLFNLIGDPLLRIRHPQPISVRASERVRAGEKLIIKASSPIAGKATIELVCRRDLLTFTAPRREKYDASDGALRAMTDVYFKAADPRWVSTTRRVKEGEFQVELTVPENARGSCHVRVFVEGKEDFAMGAADVFVRSK